MILENLSHPLDFRAKVSFVTEQVIAGGGEYTLIYCNWDAGSVELQ